MYFRVVPLKEKVFVAVSTSAPEPPLVPLLPPLVPVPLVPPLLEAGSELHATSATTTANAASTAEEKHRMPAA
jgi:hypothetical protein